MPMLKTNLIYSIAVIMITWRFNYGYHLILSKVFHFNDFVI